MRIRSSRHEDIVALIQIQEAAAHFDGSLLLAADDFSKFLTDVTVSVFVITDDDDELNTWGQAGTLEGIEGEIIGYSIVQPYRDEGAYHIVCRGAVLPGQRRRHAGRALLICDLNAANGLAADFAFEAIQEGIPVYFEVLLPEHDPGSAALAAKCELVSSAEPAPAGLVLYRREL